MVTGNFFYWRNYKGIICITFVFYKTQMKVKEVIRIIEKHGWFMISQKGSHR